MKYYAIEYSLNENVMGNIPQVKDVIHNCHVMEDPRFIDRFPFTKINHVPKLSYPVLHNNSIKTDLINVGGIGFSFGSLFISSKLKQIFEKYSNYGVHFYKSKLIQENIKDITYWQSHIYDIPYHIIDFDKTKIILRDRDINRKILTSELEVNNAEELLDIVKFLKYPKMITLENLNIKLSSNLDYFFLRYTRSNHGIVSERLKKKIESEKCTGIEFRPIEIDLNKWLSPEGLREEIYGK